MPRIAHQLFEDSAVLHVRDVTLSATDDLQSHREKLARVVLDEMYQFVGLLDFEGNVVDIDRAALEGAGIQLDDIQGKPFWDAHWWAVSEETRNLQRDCVRRARDSEFVRCDVEIYGQAGGKETIIIDFSLAPVRDDRGKIVFLLAEGRNISDKKRAEAEIARQNQELQRLLDKIRQLDQLRSDFFANVSHELRTPLALILGPAETLLATGGNLTDEQRRDIGVIQRNARTLLRHVNDLLDVAKLDANKTIVNYARIDLARETRTIAAHFDSLASQRSMSYVIRTPDRLEAEVDPEKFDRVLMNLLSNAFKFTPVGGRIECTLSAIEQDNLRLTVLDSGPGVKPELRNAIFERFRQSRGGTARDFGGTGLGLAIAKKFVELHHGAIAVSDADGGGAFFQVELPRRAPDGAYDGSQEPRPVSDGADAAAKAALDELQPVDAGTAETAEGTKSDGRPLIVVAEDNPEMRRFISEILGRDYRVVASGDGAAALAKVLAELPDLVVTDLMMPKLRGDQLVAEMRAHAQLEQVPVLVVSAIADEELRLKLLAESVQDYVVKPFSPLELRVRVRNLVVIARTRHALQKELASRNEDLSQLAAELISSRQGLKRSLDTLRTSEERWRAVFENSAVGIALTDPESYFQATNYAYQRMLGYSEDELRNLSLFDITHEDDREGNRRLFKELREGYAKVGQAENRYRRKDGDIIWGDLHISLIPRSGSTPECAIALTEEITQRKRAEERLREYEKVVEGLQEMIVVVDKEYRYLIANRAFLNYRELEREQLIGQSAADVLNPGIFENVVKQKLDECFRGNFVKYDVKYSYPGEGERDLLISYFPIEGAYGIDRAACILQDITERKHAEEALRTLSGRLLRLEDEERRRLARELHDTTGQSLAALSMNLSVVSDSADVLNPRAQAAMGESVALARQCLREIRTVAYLLHPSELDDFGLESAFSRYIDGFIQRSGIQVDVEVSPDLGRLPQAMETTVFRVLQ